MKELYISWLEYHQKIERLAHLIKKSHYSWDSIVCLAKGGLRVGDILCRIFDKPLAILFVSSYGGENNQTRGNISFSQNICAIESNLRGKILLVDDLVDSGVSLTESIKWLHNKYPQQITEIKTAVIWYKNSSEIVPDYYVDYLKDNPWIHQPFESYENFNFPSDLKT